MKHKNQILSGKIGHIEFVTSTTLYFPLSITYTPKIMRSFCGLVEGQTPDLFLSFKNQTSSHNLPFHYKTSHSTSTLAKVVGRGPQNRIIQ